ncbi:MAG: acyl CoA:acetate/3-ketoacid CoA transferase, partial [Pseudomonadota bacterium]
RLPSTPHRTAGAGGFVDITARARKIVFSGMFNAGAKMRIEDGRLMIDKEGHTPKIVEKVNQVSFSGKRAQQQGQQATYVTERCVIALVDGALTVIEIADGIDLERDILAQAGTLLRVSDNLRTMDPDLFQPGLIGLAP